jgi:cation diffusion facilitator CzcD-associated flavoprotein CzcO
MINTAIIGAGPYGLSLAAHFRENGIPFRIFGRPMDSWSAHMPKGMMLKSDGFASNISDPKGEFTLKNFCAERKIEYGDTVFPIKLETYSAYGVAFRDRMVPELEEKIITSIDRCPEGYVLRIDDGEVFKARRVVLAVGIRHFENIPETLKHLPIEFLSHSGHHSDVDQFKGRSVVVIGGGSSALDWAGLLYEAGANVQMIVRQDGLKFHGKPANQQRSLWERIQRPQTGLGPGWKSSFYANAPAVFYLLPESLRLEIVARTLGPSGGWFIKDKIIGKLPVHLGHTVDSADLVNGRVRLTVRNKEGEQRTIEADHIIAATGYKTDIDRLQFLSADIRSNIRTLKKTPILSGDFESSVPGLYFAGVTAANSFGPVMRFAFGADFNARTIAKALSKTLVRGPAGESVRAVATAIK